MFREYNFRRYDLFLVILTIVIVSLGVVAIKSATYYTESSHAVKQIIGFALGFVIMAILSLINYQFIVKFYWVIYFFNIGLLLAVLLFGDKSHGARRWIDLGFTTLQASEFCKVFLTIFLAKFIDKFNSKLNKPWFLIITVALVLIPVYLIYEEPNLSTSIIIIVISGLIIFVGGLNYKYIIGGLLIIVPALVISLWYIQQPDQKLLLDYQVERIMTALTPEQADTSKKMQTENSVQAIGSGQLFGKGLYKGKLNKYNYLPEPQTDFIFSIIGEEFGFIGCSTVLAIIFLMILRCLWIAKDTKDLTGKLIVIGFVSTLAFQTFVNVGVVIGLLPNTGVPLPFVSAGLSSLLSNMIWLGLILNISIQRKSIYN